MATPSSPFSFLDGLFDRIGSRLRPPTWAVHEIQQRAVLVLNHVLQQEPEAQQRLVRQKGGNIGGRGHQRDLGEERNGVRRWFKPKSSAVPAS